MNKIENNVVQTNVCKQELQDKSSFLSQMVETTMIVIHFMKYFYSTIQCVFILKRYFYKVTKLGI